MQRLILLVFFVIVTWIVYVPLLSAQKTSKYAGTYGYDFGEKGFGSIIVYPESDSTVLFYIEINRGAPSYNMGSMYARMSIHGDSATFYTPMDYADTSCEWTLVFTKSNLRISTLNGQFDCGFGHAVYADGNYRRKSRKISRYFESIEREIIYFDKTRPEDF